MHSAVTTGRFCGANRSRCGASGLSLNCSWLFFTRPIEDVRNACTTLVLDIFYESGSIQSQAVFRDRCPSHSGRWETHQRPLRSADCSKKNRIAVIIRTCPCTEMAGVLLFFRHRPPVKGHCPRGASPCCGRGAVAHPQGRHSAFSSC